MVLKFKENLKTLTIGAEMEIQLINDKTLHLEPASEKILSKLNDNSKLIKEMFQSTIEIISEPWENALHIEDDLSNSIGLLEQIAYNNNIVLASTGTHPRADYNYRLISNSGRYHEILERNQWLIRRMAVYGLHIHIGMRNGDACMKYMHFFNHFVPHLIALSASSPFWKSADTGLAASRPTVYESHPTAGAPVFRKSWKSFTRLYNDLIKTACIGSMKDVWWDIRPSPSHGTIEIRICDMPPTMSELVSIVAFVHMLAIWFENQPEDTQNSFIRGSNSWIIRENKWRAIRYGLDANLIRLSSVETVHVKDDIRWWLQKTATYADALSYNKYINTINAILEKGNSSARQRRVYNENNASIEKVIQHNILEFKSGSPVWE